MNLTQGLQSQCPIPLEWYQISPQTRREYLLAHFFPKYSAGWHKIQHVEGTL